MEPRTPPKFVPTLTEVAVQDAAPASEEKLPLVPTQSALAATEDIAEESYYSSGIDMLRRRREGEMPELADAAVAPSDLDIANLPTQSGWAQVADDSLLAALPAGGDAHAVPTLDDYVVDTEATPPAATPSPATRIDSAALQGADSPAVTHVEGAIDAIEDSAHLQVDVPQEVPAASAVPAHHNHAHTLAASEAATASLVASAAQAAQELEDAITRRVLKRVQETLDERLSRAVLQVVDQQTALLQSSLQLEIDATIREAVADAVAKVLRSDGDAAEQGS